MLPFQGGTKIINNTMATNYTAVISMCPCILAAPGTELLCYTSVPNSCLTITFGDFVNTVAD